MNPEIRRLLEEMRTIGLVPWANELEALLASQRPPTEGQQELADLESLPMYGATNEAQYDKAHARVLAMTAQSDPHATAARYRQALIEICNNALKVAPADPSPADPQPEVCRLHGPMTFIHTLWECTDCGKRTFVVKRVSPAGHPPTEAPKDER